MASSVTPADVRAYLVLEAGTSTSTGQYTDTLIGRYIADAFSYLQRVTGRQIDAQAATAKTFTVESSFLAIPDLRSLTSLTLDGVTLTVDTDYVLVGDPDNPGIYIGIRFSRSLIRRRHWSLPQKAVATGDWGHASEPAECVLAVTVMAAWLTKRPDAVLTNVLQVGENAVADVSRLPPEVYYFIRAWDRSPVLTAAS